MSRPITIAIPHRLGAVEARRRLEQGLTRLEQQIAGVGVAHFDKTWSGDRLAFSARAIGQSISGHLEVLDDTVQVEVQLPEMLAFIADKLKGRLRKEGQILLEKK